jgi:Tfp pilus assembly protein PilV
MMRHRDSRGFMLLEVMLAVVLVAIGLFVLLSSLGRCLAAARSVQSYSTVQNLLANKSYEFRVERPSDYLDQEGRFEDYPGYTWSRTLAATDTENLWEETITVFWWERGKLVSDSVVVYRYLPQKQR